MDKQTPETIDDCISGYPEETQLILQNVRHVISAAVPEAVEAISYGIPTFKLNGKNLVHFSATKEHLGFYPTPEGIEAFRAELSGYDTSKGTVRFPLHEPIPYDLIKVITEYRAKSMLHA
ncbi:MAG: hypothetical protein TR69_WS6001001243 [candidate division WS6 bacterium OLB20]|uniref:YdhG-like domain-containing protein n=1 Tax=candidate division WS6 bacterium OLB20 TaxID=1617426 RepID=A0A136LX61_9BACT|nr:MAG: hypothetical protein TR69_WS6001001243 [candidate division WS6 bacterium OLB20]